MADLRAYYPNYHRPVGASSTSHELPPRHYEDLPFQSTHQPQPLSASKILVGTLSTKGTSLKLSAMKIINSSRDHSDDMDGMPLLI